MSEYRIEIVRADGRKVRLYPGGIGQRDLVEAVTNAALAKGVGVFRTEAHVRSAIADGFAEVLREMTHEVWP